MAKKIRFPLEMESGVEVRSMEELREHFSLAKVLDYIQNGKMVTWLKDRYEDDRAGSIKALDLLSDSLAKEVCEIFDVPYDEKVEEELANAAVRAERVKQLKEYTEEKKYTAEIDRVAFDQDELYDLLDEDQTTIYLCGSRFSIPLAKKGISYVGINKPTVVIDSKVEVDWQAIDISVENVVYDDKYQKVIESANATKEKLYEKAVEQVKKNTGEGYVKNTYMSVLFNPSEVAKIKEYFVLVKDGMSDTCYDEAAEIEKGAALIKNEMEKIFYDEAAEIRGAQTAISESGIAGCAEEYLNEL